MIPETYANNPTTTLNGSINNSVTSITVTSGSSFPQTGPQQFRILIDSEILLVTYVNGTAFTVVRGAEGTTAASHSSGAIVSQILTKAALDAILVGPHGTVADKGSDVFLMVCHQNSDELAYLMASVDGITWAMIQRDPLLVPGSGNQRNPSIMLYNGIYYIAHTNSTNTYFTILKSTDLKNWTSVANVSLTAITSLFRVKSPRFFIDDDGTVRVFVACSTSSSTTNYQIYETHSTATDLSTWSAPVILTGTSLRADMTFPFCVKVSGTYNIWYVDEGTADIEYMSSTSLTSGYTKTYTGVWASWPTNREAPCLVQIDSTTWRIYINDWSGSNSVNVYYAESTDNWATWSTPALCTYSWIPSSAYVVRVQDIRTMRNMFSLRLSRRARGVVSKRTINQSINNNTTTAVSFPTLEKDDMAGWSSGADSKLTAPVSGWYMMGANLNWAGTSTGSRIVDLRINGSNFFSGSNRIASGATESAPGHEISSAVYLTKGDYVEVLVFQSSGANLNITAGRFWMLEL